MTAFAPVAAPHRRWTFSRSYSVPAHSLARTEEFFGLGKLAFASLWLLVFAIPWEDAITISGFGTSARLIGVVTVVLGVIAILEKAAIRRPAAGHFAMLLFVTSAAASYL